jgi:hypothetical protein
MAEFGGTAEICKTGIQQPPTAAYEFWQIPADRAMDTTAPASPATLSGAVIRPSAAIVARPLCTRFSPLHPPPAPVASPHGCADTGDSRSHGGSGRAAAARAMAKQ